MSLTLNENTEQITISRSDDGTIRYTVRNSSGVAYDVSANTFAFTVKESIDDASADAMFQRQSPAGSGIDLTLAATGIVDVNFVPTNTDTLAGRYQYDFQMTEAGKVYTLAQGLFVVRKDVTTSGVAGQPVSSREVVVDPRGVVSPFATIQDAVDYVLPLSTVADPWTIRLLSGTYSETAPISCANALGMRIVGEGQESTIILRDTAITNSVVGGTVGMCDPVLDMTSTTKCGIARLTLRHTGIQASGGAGKDPAGLVINNAAGFIAIDCRIESTELALDAENTAAPSTHDEDNENSFYGCRFAVIQNGALGNFDTFYCAKQNLRFIGCYGLMETVDNIGASGDLFVFNGTCNVIMVGSEWIRRMGAAQTQGGGRVINLGPLSGQTTRILASGCRFYLDYSQGDINLSTNDQSVIHINTGISNTGVWDVTFDGCSIEYETGTITSARTVCGILVNAPSGSGTIGDIRLIGTEVRDLAGSGGTNRKDIMIVAASSGGNKITKNVSQTGARIATYGYRSSVGSPTIAGTHCITEPTVNRQTGTATFLTAATVAVTLSTAFPVLGANQITDYSVDIEQPNGTETYWVTSKTSTGFTLNSSNASSTATVRYTVTR